MAKNLNAKIAKGKRLNTSILFEPIDAEDKGVVFPKLTDVLPTLVKKTSFDYDNVPGATVKNISIDINKIDIDKFKRKIKSISENIAKDEPKVNTSRRQAVIATNPDGPYRKASRYMLKRKTLDLMLQTLYMGRHKVKSLEGSKYFNNKDTGFRIAFTYRRLLRIYRKMIRIFSYGYNNRTSYDQPNAEIILHGKVTRLHVDFVYLFWVVIKLDDVTFAISVDLKPGRPVPHAEVLDEIFTKFLGDSYSNSALFDFILGAQSNNTDTNITTDNLDIKILDVHNVRKIINFAKVKHEQEEIAKSRRSNDFRRQGDAFYMKSDVNKKIMELMRHEIYLVKERVNTTVPFRKKYSVYPSYQIAVLYGAGTAILAKMESLLAQMNKFQVKTHFIWYLIIYEKLLACNIDINNIVERLFYVQKMFVNVRGSKSKTRHQLEKMKKRPGVPQGALQNAILQQEADKRKQQGK
uniref:Uncharacterized protein n=1 Tax=Heliothis virescens TaxID=7102 RepID=A0A2A4K709_HELVI